MKNIRQCILLTAAMVSCLPAIAAADKLQLTQLDPRFAAVLLTPGHRSVVIEAAQQSTSWKALGCTSGSFAISDKLHTWQTPVFNNAGALVSGAWGETVTATRCGAPRQLNVLTVVTKPNQLHSMVLAPGGTTADPILQRDAARYAFAVSVLPGCKQAYIDNTKTTARRPDDLHDGQDIITEIWTIIACGNTIPVQVQFLPAAGGTDVVAHKLTNATSP